MRTSLIALAVCLLSLLAMSMAQAAEVSIKQTKDIKGAIAVSSDFSLYAVKIKKGKGFYDYALKIIDMTTDKEVKTLEWDADWGNPHDASFSPDSKKLAVMVGHVQQPKTARVFDLSNGEMKLNVRHGSLQFVAFTPDSKKLASAGGPGATDPTKTLWLWDLETRKKTEIRSPSTPTCLAFSQDGKFVVSGHGRYAGDRKASLSLCDTSSGKMAARWEADDMDVTAVAFSPDGKVIASGGMDGVVHLWDAATRKGIASFDDHQEEIFSIAFHPKENLLASTAKDKTVRFWDLDKKKLVSTSKLEKLDYYLRLRFSSDGKQLATYTSTGDTVKLWSVEVTK